MRTPDCVSVERLMQWGADNRLRWVSAGGATTSYLYDADGQRIAKTGPAGTTHYFGKLFEVVDPAGAARFVKYYYAGDLLLARADSLRAVASYPLNPDAGRCNNVSWVRVAPSCSQRA